MMLTDVFMKKLSLDRILQSQGIGSRKWCRELIANGEVSIGGEVIDDYRAAFDTNGLLFTLFGEEWIYREHVYIALHKPPNFECSRKPSHHPGVLSLLPEEFSWREVQAVGRYYGSSSVAMPASPPALQEAAEQTAAR